MTTSRPQVYKLPASLRRVVVPCSEESYTYGSADRNTIGLLFYEEGADWNEHDVVRAMTAPELPKLFGPIYFGSIIHTNSRSFRFGGGQERRLEHTLGLHITTATKFLPSARGGEHNLLFLRYYEAILFFTMGDLYDNCMYLAKFSNCVKCDVKHETCLLQHLPTEQAHVLWTDTQKQLLLFPVTDLLGQYTADLPGLRVPNGGDWKDLELKNWASDIAGHTVIPPAAAQGGYVCTPGTGLTPPHQCDFRDLHGAKADLSDRSRAASETRKFIQTECKRCYFGGLQSHRTWCDRWSPRGCEHGHWTEEHLTNYTLERVAEALKDHDMTLEDLWRIACICGIRFKKKDPHTNRPREWVINRVREVYENGTFRIRILASRTARKAQGEDAMLNNIASLRAFVSPEVWDRYMDAPPMDRATLAIWAHVSAWDHARSYSYYVPNCGFHNCTPSILYVKVYGGDVRMCYQNTVWREDKTFYDLNEVNDYGKGLPLFSIWRKDGHEERINLSGWIR